MDDNLYDEFGNYIGPEIESDQESDHDEEEEEDLPDRLCEDHDAMFDGDGEVNGSNGRHLTIAVTSTMSYFWGSVGSKLLIFLAMTS